MVSHHPVKFGGCRRCGIGDIMVLVCQVILQDHVVKVHVTSKLSRYKV